MLWLILVFIALFIWTFENVIDKFVISHDLKDPVTLVTIFGLVFGMIFVAVGVFLGDNFFNQSLILWAAVGGILYIIAVWLYFYLMEYGEVSRIVPIISLKPLVVVLVSFLVFNQRLEWYGYIGVLVIVFGAILISYQKTKRKIQKSHFFIGAAISVTAFSLRNIIIEHVTTDASIWSFLFWLGIMMMLSSLIIFAIHHPRIKKKAQLQGINIMAVTFVVSGFATVLFFKAIEMGTASLVTALSATMPLFVFIVITLISKYHPKIIHEKISKPILIRKLVAIVFIILGSVLLLV